MYSKTALWDRFVVQTSFVPTAHVLIVRIIPYLCSPFRPLRGPAIALVVKW